MFVHVCHLVSTHDVHTRCISNQILICQLQRTEHTEPQVDMISCHAIKSQIGLNMNIVWSHQPVYTMYCDHVPSVLDLPKRKETLGKLPDSQWISAIVVLAPLPSAVHGCPWHGCRRKSRPHWHRLCGDEHPLVAHRLPVDPRRWRLQMAWISRWVVGCGMALGMVFYSKRYHGIRWDYGIYWFILKSWKVMIIGYSGIMGYTRI